MGLIKLLFGKTLKRMRTGEPGDLQEFFEIAKERGEKDVSVKFEVKTFPDPHPYELGTMWDGEICYKTKTLQFAEYLTHPGNLPIIAPDIAEEFWPDHMIGEVTIKSPKTIERILKRQYQYHSKLYKGMNMKIE